MLPKASARTLPALKLGLNIDEAMKRFAEEEGK